MKLYFTSVLCIFFFSVFAQQKTILDSKTKQPIPYVGVYVANYIGATADDRGVFTMPALHDSTMVRLSSIGYKDVLLRAAKLTDTIFMEVNTYNLDEVKVYGTGRKVIKVDKLPRSALEVTICPTLHDQNSRKNFSV